MILVVVLLRKVTSLWVFGCGSRSLSSLYINASSCLPLQHTSCPTFQFLLSPSVSYPTLTWGLCVLGTTPALTLTVQLLLPPFRKL